MRALHILLLLLFTAVLCCTSCNDSQPASESTTASAIPATEQEAAGDQVFTLPEDKPVDVALEFAKASHKGKPGQLSDLEFNVSAACEEKPLKSESLTLTDEEPQGTSRLDLEEYMVEVRPVITKPLNLDKGSYGSYGGYRISVRNSEGEAMCCMEVNKSGELELRSADCSKYLPYQSLALPKDNKWRYTVYPKGEGVKHEPLLAVEYTGDGFDNQNISDSEGNSYVYRFPNATLKIYNSQLATELKDQIDAEQAAYMGGGGGAQCGSGG